MSKEFIFQGLAMANNYLATGRRNKAIEMLSTINKVSPGEKTAQDLMHKIYCKQINEDPPDLSDLFGEHWNGESLKGKSIEVFCDQGIGDTLNLLRYVKELKLIHGCRIVLNCYAFFNQFEKLVKEHCNYIDEFTPFHVKCDFHTNIMSIPALLRNLEFDVYYSVHFKEVLQTSIPSHLIFDFNDPFFKSDKKSIGICWQTNADNPLSKVKTISLDLFESFKFDNVDIYCLQPDIECPDWISVIPIKDLYDTARLIQSVDAVISVDTAVLHLAGTLGKKTYGLLPFECDPRWETGETTPWYPSVELFKQSEDKNWSDSILKVKECIASFLKIA